MCTFVAVVVFSVVACVNHTRCVGTHNVYGKEYELDISKAYFFMNVDAAKEEFLHQYNNTYHHVDDGMFYESVNMRLNVNSCKCW